MRLAAEGYDLAALESRALEDERPGVVAAFDRTAMRGHLQAELIGRQCPLKIQTCNLTSAMLLDGDCVVVSSNWSSRTRRATVDDRWEALGLFTKGLHSWTKAKPARLAHVVILLRHHAAGLPGAGAGR